MKWPLIRNNQHTGAALVTGFAVIAAIQDVYLGNVFQIHDPAAVAFGMSLVAVVFYSTINLTRLGAYFKSAGENLLEIALLNLSTALSWIGFFFAVRYLEPAIEGVVGLGLTPFITLLLYPWLRAHKKLTRGEKGAAMGTGFTVALLVVVSLRGVSGLGEVSQLNTFKGFAWGLISGVGAVGNSLFSKRLYDRNWVPRQVMSLRFFGILVGSACLTENMGNAIELGRTQFPQLLLMSFGIYIIPLYILHLGLERCEPMTAALVLAMSPLLALLLENFDHRLHFSPYTFVLVCVTLGFSIFGALSRRNVT